MNILITGVTRNNSKYLFSEYEKLKKIFYKFNKVQFLLIESDSNDDTLLQLKLINKIDNNFDYISLGNLENSIPKRTERIAFCRNKYLEQIEIDEKYKDINYVMVYDWDNINKKRFFKNIYNIINQNYKWDAIFPNQTIAYYDLWALRNEKIKIDIWEFYRKIRHKKNYFCSHFIMHRRFHFKINKSYKWIPVNSAFGGFGIYKRSVITQSRYIGVNKKGDEICEHVRFNKNLRNKGYKLYIIPNLINSSINQHSIKQIKIYLFIYLILELLGTKFREYLFKKKIISYI